MKETVKRITTAILIALLLFASCSCGKQSSNVSGNSNSATSDAGKDNGETWYLGGSNSIANDENESKALFEGVDDTINPAKIYSSLNYTEEMLHGVYSLNNMEKDVKNVRKDIPFESVEFKKGPKNVSSLPIAVCFGADNLYTDICYLYSDYEKITDNEVAVLTFATEDDIGHVICTYEVSGNTVTFKRILKTSDDNEPIAYEFTGEEFKYDFKIAGPSITLSKNDSSLTLISYCFTENKGVKLAATCYSLYGSPIIDNLDGFSSSESLNYAIKKDGSHYSCATYKFCEDGHLTVYLTSEDENGDDVNFIKQYAYIAQSNGMNYFTKFGLILLDGEKEYYYTDDVTAREARDLNEQGADVDSMTEDEIKAIANKKEDLYDDLYDEFKNQGINVTINRSNGEIAMDSSVLFGGDSAELTDAGKELLDKFLAVYSSVIYNDKYDGFIEKTMIEGHTAPIAGDTYENGLPLSKERADNVKEYCVSSATGANASQLTSTLESAGLSNSKPVYDANGDVDMDACRRVSFRLVVAVK